MSFLGQPELTIQYIEKALRISPREALMPSYLFIGLSHLFVGRTDEAMGFLRKARAQNFRIWYVRLTLAGALGLTSDLEEAHGEIAEALKLKPEISSIVKWRAYLMTTGHASAPWQALMEKTVYAGLRRAGFPEE
jgi:tetratricopeptide (TPR) repeat protein